MDGVPADGAADDSRAAFLAPGDPEADELEMAVA
jgi:hypothetical protein